MLSLHIIGVGTGGGGWALGDGNALQPSVLRAQTPYFKYFIFILALPLNELLYVVVNCIKTIEGVGSI